MKLKLIGNDTHNGMKILKNIRKVEKELKYNLDIQEISVKNKDKYNVRVVPTLILDDKIISEGSIISDRELRNLIKPLLES